MPKRKVSKAQSVPSVGSAGSNYPVWFPFESEDADYGLEVYSVKNPEIVSATTVDRLLAEKRRVDASDKAVLRINNILNHIYDNEEDDAMMDVQVGQFVKESSCCIIS